MKRWLSLLLVASCGDNLHNPDASVPTDTSTPDAPVHMGVVTAKATIHSLTEAGEVTGVEQNLVLVDSAGTRVNPVATGGMLRFEPVQPGPYVVCDTSFVTRITCAQASAAAIDLDVYPAGRLDGAPGGVGTSLALTITNATASPANSGEFIDINVLNANYSGYGVPPVAANTPVLAPLSWRGQTLLKTGDVLRATQAAAKTSGTETYFAATRTGTVTNLTMVDGQTTAATVDLGTVLPQAGQATYNLRRSQFAAIAPAGMTYIGCETDGFAEKPPYQFFPWLFQHIPAGIATTDIPMSISYGVSWPGSTAQTFATTFSYRRDVMAPGATTPAPVQASLSIYRPIAELTGDVTPKVSGPRTPKVNNLDATVSQSGTTLTPTISWTAPSQGAPTRYSLYVYRVVNQGGATIASTSAVFTTVGTSFKIPTGFLMAGQAYLVTIRAEIIPGYDENRPFASFPRSELAETVTAVLQP